MPGEEEVKQKIEEKFAGLSGIVNIRRQRRIFAEVPEASFQEIFRFLVAEMRFTFLSAITGMDCLENFEVMYHLSRGDGTMFNLSLRINHEHPQIKTVTDIFPAAEAYERELADLLGIDVAGLAPGRRYPLPDDWPQGDHPLRKDWRAKNA